MNSFFIECGITYAPPNARIIGGVDSIAHSWPFAVLIRQRYKRAVTLDGDSYLVILCKKKNKNLFMAFPRFQHHGCVEEH